MYDGNAIQRIVVLIRRLFARTCPGAVIMIGGDMVRDEDTGGDEAKKELSGNVEHVHDY